MTNKYVDYNGLKRFNDNLDNTFVEKPKVDGQDKQILSFENGKPKWVDDPVNNLSRYDELSMQKEINTNITLTHDKTRIIFKNISEADVKKGNASASESIQRFFNIKYDIFKINDKESFMISIFNRGRRDDNIINIKKDTGSGSIITYIPSIILPPYGGDDTSQSFKFTMYPNKIYTMDEDGNYIYQTTEGYICLSIILNKSFVKQEYVDILDACKLELSYLINTVDSKIEYPTDDEIIQELKNPLTVFKFDRTVESLPVTNLPVVPVQKLINEDLTEEQYFTDFKLKYIVNGNELIISQEELSSSITIPTTLNSIYDNGILEKYNSYLKEGENIVEIYDMNNTVNWIIFKENNVKEIIKMNFIAKSCRCMFLDCGSLIKINISNLNINNCVDLYAMFMGCSSLTSLDLSNFDTSKVINMSKVFNNCHSLTSLDLSGLNTLKTTDISSMFMGCSSLTSLDLSGFNTTNVINTNSMFADCSSLTLLNLSSFDTSKVTDMSYMFNGCIKLNSLDLSSFDTINVVNMSNMFANCKSLILLDITHFYTYNVINMNSMMLSCSSLTSLDLSEFNTSNVTDMTNMFNGCKVLTSLNIANFNLIKVDTSKISGMFSETTALTRANIVLTNVSPESITKLEAGGMIKA